MSNCPQYRAPFEAQLGELYGGFNCTAVSAARAAAHATCGVKNVTGAQIRALSDEPVPDPGSPGLNLPQVDAALGHLGVYLDTRIGTRAVPWPEYEQRRLDGEGCILQIGYGPIADSPFDAGNGFRGNHAIFETVHSTYDSLADGRRAGVWKFDGRVYPRATIKAAASVLVIGSAGPGAVHPAPGTVWAGFTVDVIPDYIADIHPEAGNPATHRDKSGRLYRVFALYTVVDNKIVKTESARTYGLLANCTPPKNVRAGTGYRSLVQLIDHAPGREGKYVWSGFARPGHIS